MLIILCFLINFALRTIKNSRDVPEVGAIRLQITSKHKESPSSIFNIALISAFVNGFPFTTKYGWVSRMDANPNRDGRVLPTVTFMVTDEDFLFHLILRMFRNEPVFCVNKADFCHTEAPFPLITTVFGKSIPSYRECFSWFCE